MFGAILVEDFLSLPKVLLNQKDNHVIDNKFDVFRHIKLIDQLSSADSVDPAVVFGIAGGVGLVLAALLTLSLRHLLGFALLFAKGEIEIIVAIGHILVFELLIRNHFFLLLLFLYHLLIFLIFVTSSIKIIRIQFDQLLVYFRIDLRNIDVKFILINIEKLLRIHNLQSLVFWIVGVHSFHVEYVHVNLRVYWLDFGSPIERILRLLAGPHMAASSLIHLLGEGILRLLFTALVICVIFFLGLFELKESVEADYDILLMTGKDLLDFFMLIFIDWHV